MIEQILKYFRYRKYKRVILKSNLFDLNYYLTTYKDVKEVNVDPIWHYIRYGVREGRNPNEEFNTNFYLNQYPDVKKSGINPLVHYIKYGESEKRYINHFTNFISNPKAKKRYSKDKDTVVFVSHESSATGAPLLGLNIIKELNKNYNVISIVLKKSNIHSMFYDDCFMIIDDIDINSTKHLLSNLNEKFNIKCAICNSIVTYPILKIANDLKIATLSLVHEFAEYIKPKEKMLNNIIYANRVVVPAEIIKESIFEQLKEVGIKKIPSNISIKPQGKLKFLSNSYGEEDTKEELLSKLNIKNIYEYKIVVASGYVNIRKGVDLFIYTAKYIKKYYNYKCKFVWVGGFYPEKDINYSIWLKREIKYLGLEEDFIFLEHQKSLNTIFKLADIFCLTSRLDPFPNVVIDALALNLPIACFNDTSGCVEFLKKHRAECLIADYLDTHQLGEMIAKYLEKNRLKSDVNQRIVEKNLNFDNYMKYIFNTIEKIVREQKEILEIFEAIKGSNYFNSDFYGLNLDRDKSIMHYIALCKKNIDELTLNFNPNFGFSNQKWFLDNKKVGVPLYEALKSSNFPKTHRCVIVPSDKKSRIYFKYAIHLHLYYIDLAEEFNRYFQNLPKTFDLYVTIVNENRFKKDVIEEKFKDCGAKKVEVIVVNNIGRDIGALFFNTMKEILLRENYEVIGHFHSKKSIHVDSSIGNRWRRYLMENLMGTGEVAITILNLFNDASIGLIFAEDRHHMDIGENRVYLENLCSMMNIDTVKETPIFPLGNMFWARFDAIKQLFELNEKEVLKKEPLPYDGSYMHAIERITPYLVEKNYYDYVTVYKEGTKW